jgi:hypothetical protein
MAGLRVPLANATPTPLPSWAYGSGLRWLARPFSYGSRIRNSKPVYPGDFNNSLSPPATTSPFQIAKEQKLTRSSDHTPRARSLGYYTTE